MANALDDKKGNQFAGWIGYKSRSEDVVTERLEASFRATFAPNLASVAEGEAPLGLHWCLSPPVAAMTGLGPDGHPAKNQDMPPIPLPRRMWAGGTIQTLAPLRIGDHVTRLSTIVDITHKEGRSGELWFVALQHEYVTKRGPAMRERQDIVYREATSASPAQPGEVDIAKQEKSQRKIEHAWTIDPTATLLFRYSALTFNGHRIHYDLPYATKIEGYGGLVVHGPLQATLLLNLAASQRGSTPANFVYRGLSPATAGNKLFICSDGPQSDHFWTEGPSGSVHMEARTSA